jgi:hypothetical protein
LQREIGAVDGLSRRKYLQDFTEAYRTYQRVMSKEQLIGFCAGAGSLLVSDFHALDSCQFFLCELLEQIAEVQTRPLVLLLEAIFTRDQHILDEWQVDEISDSELRQRLRFALDWGYEWEPFLHTLKIARNLHIPIFGADCGPRGNMRRIGRRDRHAADTVKLLRDRFPDALVVVFFGESHLAPDHLPSEIARQLPDECVRLVLQNVDNLYFRAAGELHDRIEALQVSANAVAVFNASPVEKWQSYRLCIERWREESRKSPDFTPLLYDLIDALLDFLHIDRYGDEAEGSRYFVDCYPEVTHVGSHSRAQVAFERSGLPESRRNGLALHLAEHGSCYIPELNLIMVHRLRMLSAARDVAHFVHNACRSFEATAISSVEEGDFEERFYARTLEHALMDFGARVLYPSHPINEQDDLFALYAENEEDPGEPGLLSRREHTRVLDCVMLHRDYELHSCRYAVKPQLLSEMLSAPHSALELLTKYLGGLLGSDLYRAYLEGHFRRSAARSLMFRKLAAGGAREAYFSLVRRVRRSRRLRAA